MLQGNKWNKTNSNEYYDSDQIREIITVCGVNIGSELETHFLVFCPFHNNRNTPACEIDKEKGLFICFACGENGTIYDIVMRTTNRSYFEAQRIISKAAKNIDLVSNIQKTMEPKAEFVEFEPATIRRLHNTLLDSENAKEYFRSRNISPESIDKFNLGYSDKQDMVIVPVYSHTNICVGFVGRSVQGKAFKNSTGLPRAKVLFNMNNCKFNNIVVVESSFDAIRLSQIGVSAVATLGANISANQLALLDKYANSIIIAADSDDAGKEMTEKIYKGLPHKSIRVMPIAEGKKDIGDMTNAEILTSFNSTNALDFALSV